MYHLLYGEPGERTAECIVVIGLASSRGSISCKGTRLFSKLSRRAEVHPASYSTGTGSPFPGVKRPGCGTDHSPPSSAEVTNEWNYTSSPLYIFMAT